MAYVYLMIFILLVIAYGFYKLEDRLTMAMFILLAVFVLVQNLHYTLMVQILMNVTAIIAGVGVLKLVVKENV